MEHRLNVRVLHDPRRRKRERKEGGRGGTRVSANASMPLERNIFVPSPLTLERY